MILTAHTFVFCEFTISLAAGPGLVLAQDSSPKIFPRSILKCLTCVRPTFPIPLNPRGYAQVDMVLEELENWRWRVVDHFKGQMLMSGDIEVHSEQQKEINALRKLCRLLTPRAAFKIVHLIFPSPFFEL